MTGKVTLDASQWRGQLGCEEYLIRRPGVRPRKETSDLVCTVKYSRSRLHL